MAKLGALITATLFGFLGLAIFGHPAAFWLFFCFSAFIGVPIGAVMDIAHNLREQRESRADARLEAQSDAIAAAIERGRSNVNIDARAIHLHEGGQHEVRKVFEERSY